MVDRRTLADYPEPIAAAYQKVVLAEHPRDLHDVLQLLGHALLEHIWLVLRSEYVSRRDAAGADPQVENALGELVTQANVSWGHTWCAIVACWRGPRDNSALKVSPASRKGRDAIHFFVTTWTAVKAIWVEHHGAPANLPYEDLITRRRKDDKAGLSLHRFFGDLINCRNAISHRDKFTLSEGEDPISLDLGDAYFAAVNPPLQHALEELLVEMQEFLLRTPTAEVTGVSGRPDGSFVVRFMVRTGVGHPREWQTDEPKRFVPGQRWLLGPDGRPVLRLVDDYFPVLAAPPAPTPDHTMRPRSITTRPRLPIASRGP
jgi:hypothetical protein